MKLATGEKFACFAFSRCAEALVKPDIGNTRNQFAHRLQTTATANPQARETLLQIFDLRSQVEHMHLAIMALEGEEKERIALPTAGRDRSTLWRGSPFVASLRQNRCSKCFGRKQGSNGSGPCRTTSV